MGGLFGGGKQPQAQKQQPAGALNIQTSVYGQAKPLVYGKNRVPINLIHYFNFRPIAHTTKQKTGGKGGGGKAQSNTTYTYQTGFAGGFAVGGSTIGIGTVWKNKEKHTLASLGLTLFKGDVGQTAWASLPGGQQVPYANLAFIGAPAFDLGDSPSLPNLNLEVKGLVPYQAGTIDDALPSDIISDYLTNPRHGAGFGNYLGDLDLGPASFRKYCLARGLFISPMEQNQRQAGAFLKDIADITNSAIVWRSGKLYFIPYGDATISGNGATYTPNLTPLYDLGPDDFMAERNQPPVKHKEKSPEQQYNHHRIEYNARSNDYNPLIVELKDQADIDDNGLRTKAVTTYKAITLDNVARDVLQIQQQRDLHVKNTYSFRLGIRHSLLEPMDLVTLTEPGLGLDRQLVRIVDVVEQDDAIDVVAEEMNIGVANSPLFNTQSPLGYNQDFNVAPGAITDPLIMNAPGFLTETGYEQWIAVASQNANWGGAVVWVSDDNVTYRRVGEVYGSARYGSVSTATFPAGTADYDTTSVLRAQLYTGQMISGSQQDCDEFRTLLYVGGEWMSYRDAVLVSGSVYDIDTFRRAAYGSTRASHAVGQGVAVIDEAIFRMPYDKGNIGKTVYFKFQSFNVFGGGLVDLSAVSAVSHVLGASELTAPMEYLEIGGNGANLLPDNYSTFEASALPSFAGAPGTVTRDASSKKVVASLSMTLTALNPIFFFCPSGSWNIPHTKGKQYIVSFYYSTTVVGSVGIQLEDNTPAQSAQTVIALTTDGQWNRASCVVDASALTGDRLAIRMQVNATATAVIKFDGVMVEEAVGTLNRPSAYTRGTAAGVALSALIAAQNAQATADGQIDIYRQSAAPSIGGAGAKLGDYWQDSDDGKWWYCNGSSWVESPDNRLPQVVIDAAAANSAANTAQTTANARIRLFVQEAQPTGGTYIVGDQWYQDSTKTTRYYNGTGWSLQADQSGTVTSGVPNGRFESGFNYWTNQGFWAHSPTGGMNGTGRAQVIGTTTSGIGYRLFSTQKLPVRVGQRLIMSCHAARNVHADDGIVYLSVFYWDAAGNAFGYDDQTMNADTAGGGYVFVRKFSTVPANAVYATVGLMVLNQNANGGWGIDNIDLRPMADNKELAAGVGKNLLKNASFGKKTGSVWPWVPGWNPNSSATTFKNYRDTWTYSTYKMPTGANVEFRQGAPTGGSPGVTDWGTDAVGMIPVKAGKRYEMHVRAAAYRCSFQLNVAWFDATGTYITEAGTAWMSALGGGELPTVGYPQAGTFVTAPSNAAGAVMFFRKGDTAAGQADSVVFLTEPYFGEAADNQVDLSPWSEGPLGTADEIADGYDSTTVALEDVYKVGFSRRVGLGVKGSRKTLGGARNSRANLVQGIPSVRTTAALTANSSGQVTVNAHSLEISGETVSYNAVTNAVTGLTQGATYIIFTLDPYLDGGTRTYYAQTSSLSAQQAGEGAVMMGNITIPTSGSSGGGGGGGGIDPCVAIDMYMPEGHQAFDVERHDLVQVWDECDPPGAIQLECQNNTITPDVECWRMVSESGAAVVASYCTPMTLRDMSIKYVPEMLGEYVLVQRNEVFTWERVVECYPVGKRTVAKISVYDSMYFAGETAEATIATHNVQYKP